MKIQRNDLNTYERLKKGELQEFFLIIDGEVVRFQRKKVDNLTGHVIGESISRTGGLDGKYTVTVEPGDEDELFPSEDRARLAHWMRDGKYAGREKGKEKSEKKNTAHWVFDEETTKQLRDAMEKIGPVLTSVIGSLFDGDEDEN